MKEINKQILIIGYGNTLRNDDGAGPFVAGELNRKYGNKINIIETHQLLPEIAENISKHKIIIFIDAFISDKNYEVIVEKIELQNNYFSFSHIYSAETLMSISKELYNTNAEAYIIKIPAVDFNFGDKLSEVTKTKCFEAIKKIENLIEQITSL